MLESWGQVVKFCSHVPWSVPSKGNWEAVVEQLALRTAQDVSHGKPDCSSYSLKSLQASKIWLFVLLTIIALYTIKEWARRRQLPFVRSCSLAISGKAVPCKWLILIRFLLWWNIEARLWNIHLTVKMVIMTQSCFIPCSQSQGGHRQQ